MIKVIGFALEAAGAPIVKGGAQALLDAFARLIADKGGLIVTGADVVAVDRDGKGRARGVTLADGRRLSARNGVICSMAPEKLYRDLLAGTDLPPALAESLGRYRYGKGNMQIHYALDRPPRWRTAGLDQVALLHLTPGLDGVSKAANEAERGMLPEVPTICVGQPTVLDPSRAPAGKAVLWLQLPEAPRHINGDAARLIAPPADGRWTEALREAYADRVEAILARHIEGFGETILGRRAYSPADLEAMNANLVGGDPYGGFCGLDQFFLWRPFKGSMNHTTPVPGLYHIGASTHPGPGLGGGSGFLPRPIAAVSGGPKQAEGASARTDAAREENRPKAPALPPARSAWPPTDALALPSIGEIGLNQFAPYLLNRLSAQWNGALQGVLKDLGISTTKFRALAVLTVASGITVNDLAVFAVTEQSTMSRTLDALEDQDLIRRKAKPGDMRVREVFITDKGIALFGAIWPDIYGLYARFFKDVDEAEFRGFVATLHKVLRNTRNGDQA